MAHTSISNKPIKFSLNPHRENTVFQDQWIPLTPIEKMSETNYDVIIVGTGAGGGAALWRLCEQWGRNGKRIGVVEAGDLLLPTASGNIPTVNGEIWGKLWTRNIDPTGIIALGGQTLFWGLESPRFDPSAFITWPITYKDILPYYLIAEQVMNVTTAYTRDSALQQVLLDRSRSNGFPEAQTMPIAIDLGTTKYGQVHSNPIFSSINFIAYAINIRSIDLSVNTPVVQVLTDKGRAAGVKVMTADKKTYTLSAKTVILSASTFNTPRILLNSNIPGEAIGRYLKEHATVSADVKTRRDEYPEVLGTSRIYVPDSAERGFQLLALGPGISSPFAEKPLAEEINFRFQTYGPLEPRPDNRVFLDPGRLDPYGIPRLNVQYSYNSRDLERIERMFEGTRKFISSMNFTLQEPPELWQAGNHFSGTCRMGNDPATSVTDAYGQVHGIAGLYVADNSVLNLTSGSNPTLTTVALAIRTADHIIETMI
ncbi:GMC oxidoreductase [Paenibacillus sp. Soil522]|uniref:GMC oxidoreductase n=1 Tax=Paenibacillus sp. Soil522 TaxID=1736388 RepID=UPI0006FB416B|nr:GMC family oxidoreductase [Paenibacillus sp. Soil522]KRE45379.1 hypothetical protein ASG81_13270 [Paenibacillus sp. Soil522]